MVDWVFKYRPTNFDEMALYPELRERLSFYAQTNDFSHLLLTGDTGVGKTTTARILGDQSSYTTIEEDCAAENTKARMLTLVKGTTSGNLFGTKRLLIMDEFHEIPMTTQKVFNKVLEDNSERNIFIFCVNSVEHVAPPVVSRCMRLNFDVGVIDSKTSRLKMFPHHNMSRDDWANELKRIGRIVAEKDGRKVSEEQLDRIASIDLYLTDPRKFIRALEERIKMDELKQ
jgi:DNA polymerase III delta prime subunit|tara:strand:- start:1515 stop:2201 length:687 start_codon:yes stop_codon:yes gene_type:complete